MADEEITFKDGNKMMVFLLVSILTLQCVFIIVSGKDKKDTIDDRIERIEDLMQHNTYSVYGMFTFNDNTTLGDLKQFYWMQSHITHKYVGMAIATGYICDGTGDDVFDLYKN